MNQRQSELGRSLTVEERFDLLDALVTDMSKGNKLILLIYDGELLYVHTNYADSLYYSAREDALLFATTPLDSGNWEPHPFTTLCAYRDGRLVFQGTNHGRQYRDNGRKIVENPLIYRDGKYAIDFDDFERKVTEHNVKRFILCSPHNPIGRVWTVEDLRRLGSICQMHGVYVVSDEIHCDFAFPEHPHHVFLEAVPELAERAVVCTAPSKTFNLAGLQVSNIWIPGEDIRKRFLLEIARTGYSQLNTMGLVACQAAYESGGEWLEQCRAYLRGNLDFLRAFLRERIPQIRLVEPEGTYFAWLDCSGLKLNRRELNDLIVNRARLWLDAGHIFGQDAGQFQRVVLACPRATLRQALEKLEQAVVE